MNLNNVDNIGDGIGPALIALDHSTVDATEITVIIRSVTVDDDSTINISSVLAILGGVSVSGRVTLELTAQAFSARSMELETRHPPHDGRPGCWNAASFNAGTIDLRSVWQGLDAGV